MNMDEFLNLVEYRFLWRNLKYIYGLNSNHVRAIEEGSMVKCKTSYDVKKHLLTKCFFL
jgi:hypothetical protein